MHILEIGQAGPLPNNTHRRLIPPNINKNLKPEVNSKKISLGGYQYSFKDVLLGKKKKMFSLSRSYPTNRTLQAFQFTSGQNYKSMSTTY